MKQVFLILGIHNHQPVGNFDFVLEDAFQKAYWPFLKILEQHPHIKISLHYSGILWEWFESEHPQIIDLFYELLEKGQIEFLSGGFYEPILSIIPDKDKLGQMEKMTIFLNQKFGIRPRGMWLAERVWEPGLPKFISNAGLDYVIVDDRHFLAAGLDEKDLYGYYLTDDQGKVIKVFPGSKELRYLIPFQVPEKTIEYLIRIREQGSGDLAMMGDDGEKFGIWPGTYTWVYEQKWLEHFFDLIEKNKDWLKMCTYSEYISERSPIGQIYLPSGSYAEMEEWALPLNAQEVFHSLRTKLNRKEFENSVYNFIRGGLWRNFLCKYKEGNNIYNRMLLISQKIEDIENLIHDNKRKQENAGWLTLAKDELWKGQCNDAYWHGLFGGLYLPHLRAALYRHLIKADNLIEEHRHSKSTWTEWLMRDMDQDGFDEIEISTDKYCIFIDPYSGGAIYEWDFRPKCFNVINSFIRRPEIYHQKILGPAKDEKESPTGVRSIHDIEGAREEGLEKILVYDKYIRNSLLDHFLDPSTTIEQFSSLQYKEIGDFLEKPYSFQVVRDSENIWIRFSRTGTVNPSGSVNLSKALTISPGETLINVLYSIENLSDSLVDAVFGIEFNFNLLAGSADDRYYQIDDQIPRERHLASFGSLKGIERVCLVDKSAGIIIGIHSCQKADVWRFPIETASNSEAGFEKVYQSSAIFFHWPLYLHRGEKQTYNMDCWVREIS
ncbi:MAG: alpha-amylase/4-alpha-glucanotransferase domain-containing protein [bacterium]